MRFLVLLLGLAVLAFPQNPNTAVYPNAIADDEDLLVASPLATGALASAIDDSTLTIVLGDASTFVPPMIIDIGGERIKVCSKATNTLTVCSGGRGFNGTTATIHAAAAPVNGYVTSYQMNQVTSEIKAIETILGTLGASGGANQFVKQSSLGGTLSVSTISDGDLPETHTMDHDSIGVTSTDALILQNATAAAAGAQQWSPRIRFTGQGWKTATTAASQQGDWIVENQMVQDDTAPATELVFSSQVNGGGYSPVLTLRQWDDGQGPSAPWGYVEAKGTSTRAGSTAIDALSTKLFANPSGTATGYFEGTSAFVQAQGANNFTSTFGGIIGHGAWTEGNHTGTVTSMVGYQAYADLENTGGVTDLKFFEALTPDVFSSGTFTNVYGLYVRNQNIGTSINRSIFTAGGSAEINTGAVGTVGLYVDAAASQTANLQEWRNSSDSALASVSAAGVISSAVGTSSGNVSTIDGIQVLSNKTLLDPSVNDVLTFIESAGDATCSTGDYWIKGNSTTGTLRGCENGSAFSLNTSSAAYATIDDEDTPLTQRSTLNFEGAGVTCADDIDQTTCTIPGGGGGAVTLDTYANEPATCSVGDIFRPTDSPMLHGICTSTNTWSYDVMGYQSSLPSSSGWSYVNQASSTNNFTYGPMYFATPKSGAVNISALCRSPASSINGVFDFSIIRNLSGAPPGSSGTGNDEGYGVSFYESGTGKHVSFMMFRDTAAGLALSTSKWTSATSFSAHYVNYGSTAAGNLNNDLAMGRPMNFRLDLSDSTNIKFYWTVGDRANWELFDTRAKADFLTTAPDQVCVVQYASGGRVVSDLIHYSGN